MQNQELYTCYIYINRFDVIKGTKYRNSTVLHQSISNYKTDSIAVTYMILEHFFLSTKNNPVNFFSFFNLVNVNYIKI